MLVTVSGIVGSGKSTISQQVVEILQAHGIPASQVRFQSLPCFSLLRSSLRGTGHPGAAAPAATSANQAQVRWMNYRRKTLWEAPMLLYAARIVAFRVYRLSLARREWMVLNRFFYDIFVHYELNTRRERLYFALLRSMLPKPDLAIVAIADDETITARRPTYSSSYIHAVGDGYRRLAMDVPDLVTINTGSGHDSARAVARLLAPHISR